MKNDDRLIYLIFMGQQKLKTHITGVLLDEDIKVTLGQTGILFSLQHKDGQTMTELSRTMAVENPTLTGLIDRLERSSLVMRKVSPEDRRSFRICITPEGIRECEKVKPIIRRINDELKTGFTGDEIEVFKKVLHSISMKFDKLGKGRR